MKKIGRNMENKIALAFIILAAMLFSISIASAVTITNVETTPSEISPGDTAKITIEIENTLGNDIENVNVALDLSGNIPIAPYQGSSEENIDEIKEGNEEKFTFNIIVLPEADSGIYKIPISINYQLNSSTPPETKNSTISLIVNSEPKMKLSIEGYLIKGIEGKIELRIVNDGLSDLKFVSIQASQTSGITINSPFYEYIGNIDSDDFETVEYSVYAKENLGASVSIPFEISYKDSTNKDFTLTENLNVKVYSLEEAVNLGLVPRKSFILPIVLTIIPLLYIVYRIRKKMKRKKALGA